MLASGRTRAHRPDRGHRRFVQRVLPTAGGAHLARIVPGHAPALRHAGRDRDRDSRRHGRARRRSRAGPVSRGSRVHRARVARRSAGRLGHFAGHDGLGPNRNRAAVGAAIGHTDALVKTGTAPCSHSPRGSADSYTIIVYPANRPRVVLLVQAHGRTGAETAASAGALLTGAVGARGDLVPGTR